MLCDLIPHKCDISDCPCLLRLVVSPELMTVGNQTLVCTSACQLTHSNVGVFHRSSLRAAAQMTSDQGPVSAFLSCSLLVFGFFASISTPSTLQSHWGQDNIYSLACSWVVWQLCFWTFCSFYSSIVCCWNRVYALVCVLSISQCFLDIYLHRKKKKNLLQNFVLWLRQDE